MYEDHYGVFDFMRTVAPDFPPDHEWVNIKKKLSLKKNLKGHVVVLDFWTYCCINCIHTIPDLQFLEKKYKKDKVIFIGVHSAKFFNERNKENVKDAIQRYGINHPVILDNNHKIWNSHAVNSWPTIVIIDSEGKTLYHHSGENQLDPIMDAIDYALKEGKRKKTLAKEKISIKITLKKSKNTLSFPGKIWYDDRSQELLISDSGNNRILITKLKDKNAKIQAEVGSGKPGFKDGTFKTALFKHPQGLVKLNDKIYVADTGNHAIRVIDLKTKKVSTIAGTGKKPVHTYEKAGNLSSPWDLIIHHDFLYIAMAGCHQIWRLDLKTNKIAPYAGNSGEDLVDGSRNRAWLAQPSGLTTDGNDIFFVDSETSSVRKLDLNKEKVTTLIGKGLFVFGHQDGLFDQALLQHPLGIHFYNKQLYLADTYNNAVKVLDLKSKTKTTLVGTKEKNRDICTVNKGGMKTCKELPLNEPNDVIALEDKILIADTNNHVIRILDRKTMKLYMVKVN